MLSAVKIFYTKIFSINLNRLPTFLDKERASFALKKLCNNGDQKNSISFFFTFRGKSLENFALN